MSRNKANLRFSKNKVLNLCTCKCGGDWFIEAEINTNHNGILGHMDVWQCDNCGKLFERNIQLQKIVIEENLTEVNL